MLAASVCKDRDKCPHDFIFHLNKVGAVQKFSLDGDQGLHSQDEGPYVRG